MAEPDPFHDLIQRVRAGDQQAAAELVRRYEPAIRRAVRIRTVDRRLQTLFDSMDICQSVLGSFFVRVALGEYELGNAEQLLKLLMRMARNKAADAAKKERAACRDYRRAESLGTRDFARSDSSPSEVVAGRELLEEVRRRLTPDERQLAEQRTLGRSWAEIAVEHGSNADALRIRLARAMDRITRELGIEP
jgi:RNA polymerase sigma-70 factor (ECF subfamily)